MQGYKLNWEAADSEWPGCLPRVDQAGCILHRALR